MSLIKIGLCLLSTFFVVIGFIANAIEHRDEGQPKAQIIIMGLYSLSILPVIIILILET